MAKRKQIPTGPQSSPEDRRRQENQWRNLLEEQSQSGLKQREFCRRQSIPEHRFSWWKREIARRDGRPLDRDKTTKRAREPRGSIVPVRIRAQGFPSAQLGGTTWFEIVLACGRVLRVPPQFEEEDLTRLLRLLEERC